MSLLPSSNFRGLYLAKQQFNRTYKHPSVTSRPVREGRLRGSLYTPAGPGPFPVVLDLFGTAGGLIETRAALLASHGFMTLALAYFAYEDLQTHLDRIDLDYFEEGLNYLLKQPNAIKSGAGMVGVSKGAEIALMMSEFMPQLTAIVSINGLYFRSTNRVYYKEEELPIFLPDYGRMSMPDNAMYLIDCFDNLTKMDEKCIIKVEKSNAQFLLIASENDGQCPPLTTERCADRLKAAGKEANYEYLLCKGAGHLLEAPHSPFCYASYHSKFGCSFLWGGAKIAHTRAQEMAWPKILNFLRESLDPAGTVTSKL